MALGIIGEYVGRIYDEVKKRPLYVIKKYAAADKVPPDEGADPGRRAWHEAE